MNKIFILIISLFILHGCSYKPILSNKEYNFKLKNINYNEDNQINNVIKKNLLNKSKDNSNNVYDIIFSSQYEKEIVSSNEKGDPTIFKKKVSVSYSLIKGNKIIFSDTVQKVVTYNNIDDKFELLKYEENILDNLLENISSEILMTITDTYK